MVGSQHVAMLRIDDDARPYSLDLPALVLLELPRIHGIVGHGSGDYSP
jgi:hypothetical protein